MDELEFKKTLGKIADRINTKRRNELFTLMDFDNPVFKYLSDLRKQRTYMKGGTNNHYRKIASLPIEVDVFFSRVYGEDYYKEKDFFVKRFPEWAVIDRMDL